MYTETPSGTVHAAPLKIMLTDGSCIHLLWLSDGSLSAQHFKPATWTLGNGYMVMGTGTVDPETVATFLAVLTPPPAA